MTSDSRLIVCHLRIAAVNALHPLGQLIQSIEDSKGWTVREIGRRTDEAPKSLTHTYIGRLKREPIRSVTYDMVQSLAIGLNVPERIVAAAAVESMGVHDIGTAEVGAAVAIARDPDLSERDRRILLAVVREMHGEHTDDGSTRAELNEAPPQGSPPAGGRALAYPAQPDGITSTAGAREPDTSRGMPGAGEVVEDLDRPDADDRPWEQDEYGLAAKRGRNRGREAREQQDSEAEDGGA